MLSNDDVQKFNTLIEINGLINSYSRDLNSVLTEILDAASRSCGGECSNLLLLNKENEELYFEVVYGKENTEIKKFTVKKGEGISGWAALHNKPIIVNDAFNDERIINSIYIRTNFPREAILAVPVRLKDECIGVIELAGKSFSQKDLEWLEILANQAGLAIGNSIVRQESSLAKDELNVKHEYHTLIAKSPIILEKLDIIDRVAKTDSSVLILGESGVGKELFAEQVHLRSPRKNKAFVRVNCAALPEGLMESELFGHVKGAFTNAINTRPGRFEQADGGTIFLDEIGDLSLVLQAKLLRVIQQKSFEKLGSDITLTVDVRILAATNKDIEKLVEQGQFRSDLYYRLNVLPLYIPPLRQRPEDIGELAKFFLNKFMKQTKKHFDGFSDEAMDLMLSHSWPGNIRELENCIERACVISKNKLITKDELLLNKSGFSIISQNEGIKDLKNAINDFKAQYIRKVLMENKWNQTETARVLDIQRTYLSRLIKEMELINLKEMK